MPTHMVARHPPSHSLPLPPLSRLLLPPLHASSRGAPRLAVWTLHSILQSSNTRPVPHALANTFLSIHIQKKQGRAVRTGVGSVSWAHSRGVSWRTAASAHVGQDGGGRREEGGGRKGGSGAMHRVADAADKLVEGRALWDR